MSLFLLQSEKSPNALPNKALFSEDVSSAFARIDEYNWRNYSSKHRCMTASLAKLHSMFLRTLKSCVPIGSIEFVEEVLRLAHDIPQISPIVLPDEILSHPEWMGRRFTFEDSISKAPEVFDRFDTHWLFMKSASRLKTDYTGIYKQTDPLPQTSDKIFFSETVNISSEWRIFVSRSTIKAVRFYAGDPWLLPDKTTVLDMVSAIGQKYPSYTMDVGVVVVGPAEKSRTIAIEVHNFISCGLYGAVLPLSMYLNAYRYEIKSHKK